MLYLFVELEAIKDAVGRCMLRLQRVVVLSRTAGQNGKVFRLPYSITGESPASLVHYVRSLLAAVHAYFNFAKTSYIKDHIEKDEGAPKNAAPMHFTVEDEDDEEDDGFVLPIQTYA